MKQKKRNILFACLIFCVLILTFGGFCVHQNRTQRLTDGFPTIPNYPNSQFVRSEERINTSLKNPEKYFIATWTSPDSPQNISLWFRNNLTENGWTEVVSPGNPGQPIQLIEFQNKTGTLTLSLFKIEAKTEIDFDFRPTQIATEKEK